jgi:phosphoribosylaminoimidazole carboxylase (NCAIR synthetase)
VRPGHEPSMWRRTGWRKSASWKGWAERTAPYGAVDSLADLKAGLAVSGMPAILKTRRFGYDGKGQARIERESSGCVRRAGRGA